SGVLVPGAHTDERGAVVVCEDSFGVVDVDDQLGALWKVGAEGGDRGGKAWRRLKLAAALGPGVVAAVEHADILDAAVGEDQRCPSRCDLAGSAAGPALVRTALGIAAVQDHSRVTADPERSQRRVEFLRRTAVPAARAFELVRVEVERAGTVAVRVFLRDA